MQEGHIRVRPAVLASIEAHARAAAPFECCGLLVGRAGRIDEAVPVENRAGDPRRLYEIDPADYLAAIRRARGRGDLVAGAYHSHPRSSHEPSPTDLESAFGDFVYLIAGPVQDAGPVAIGAYRLKDGNFEAVRLVLEPEEPQR